MEDIQALKKAFSDAQKALYRADHKRREKAKTYIKTRYKNDPEFREKMKAAASEWYEKNKSSPEFKRKSRERAAAQYAKKKAAREADRARTRAAIEAKMSA